MHTQAPANYSNICAYMFDRAEIYSDKAAYIFLEDGEAKEIKLSYAELANQVRHGYFTHSSKTETATGSTITYE